MSATDDPEKTAGKTAGKTGGGGDQLRITLVRGWAGKRRRQQRTLRSLGLRRTGDSNVIADSPSLRGAIEAVAHLVRVDPAG